MFSAVGPDTNIDGWFFDVAHRTIQLRTFLYDGHIARKIPIRNFLRELRLENEALANGRAEIENIGTYYNIALCAPNSNVVH